MKRNSIAGLLFSFSHTHNLATLPELELRDSLIKYQLYTFDLTLFNGEFRGNQVHFSSSFIPGEIRSWLMSNLSFGKSKSLLFKLWLHTHDCSRVTVGKRSRYKGWCCFCCFSPKYPACGKLYRLTLCQWNFTVMMSIFWTPLEQSHSIQTWRSMKQSVTNTGFRRQG